ncbi:hypothetical protein [Streptomyces sp. NRRL F-2747]|uniref:hypothetical protein n=1 Tax=Streptomyces sp. NRRL F-2747 TaxID=1463843 RepID=UPI001F2C03C3|nr:hypothetical protein [Streptomyces sp. NRRL F-2747]
MAIYLNDHLAGAGSGVSLIRRMARAHRNRHAAEPLAELAAEIAEDRDSLREFMTALDVTERWPRVAVGRLAEKAARLKFNGRLVRRSPLSDVLELEAMRLGVEGKASLWRSLRALAVTDSRLDPSAVDRLLDRAVRQEAVLEGLRVQAARRTFTTGTTVAAPGRSGRARHSLPGRAGWAS